MPKALPTPAFFKDLPLPGLSAGPGNSLDYRIGLSPRGPGVKDGSWIWLVIFGPLLVMLIAVVLVFGLVIAIGTLLLAPVVPKIRRGLKTSWIGWRHPVQIELDRHPVVPGESATVLVRQKRIPRIEEMRIVLVCEEEATWSVGTNTESEENIVLEEIVAAFDPNEVVAEVQAEVPIPLDAMHSFEAEHNTIRWRIEVHRSYPGANTDEDEAEFQVLPIGVIDRLLDAPDARNPHGAEP